MLWTSAQYKGCKGSIEPGRSQLNDKGEPKVVADQISSLRKSVSYLFDHGHKEPYRPKGGEGKINPALVYTMTEVFKGETNK